MNFVSYEDLTRDCRAFAATLAGEEIGAVVGVPRSGMIAASILAQELDVHLGELGSFVSSGGAFMRPGRRMTWQPEGAKVLVVDDSVYAGSAIEQTRLTLRAHPGLERRALFAALYVAPGMEDRVDTWFRRVETPRLFAWNWRHSEALESALVDLDGVFCCDPIPFDDGGDAYAHALATAIALPAIRRRVLGIVTGRLERWREVTETWLDGREARFGSLVMAPYATPEERRAHRVERWKASVYRDTPEAKLFVESDPRQAEVIREVSGKPVLCPATGDFLG